MRSGFVVVGVLAVACATALLSGRSAAHYAAPLPDSRVAPPARQFGLPFAGEPGPDTWLLGQAYGNTPGAYRRRYSDYRAGQGIHFGLDISAPCGTPVRAIGAGTVVEVDGPHGSEPHNLVLDHGQGLSSLYGHLQRRPSLRVGTRVQRGDVIGVSGDSQFTCVSAPHLHLEIRDSSHQRFFNPVPYINADWDALALAGGFSRGFQRDLDHPRRWQRLDDQPQARRGGALLNEYARPWPPAPNTRLEGTPARIRVFPPAPASVEPEALPVGQPRALISGGCCMNPTWSADSSRVLFIDRPGPDAPTGLYAVSALEPDSPRLELSGLAFFSPGFRFALHPQGWLERLSDGQRVRLNTGGNAVTWSRSESRVAWSVSETQGNFDRLGTQVFTASVQNSPKPSVSSPRRVATVYGGNVVGWVGEDRLLVTGKSNRSDPDRELRVLDVNSGSSRVIARARNFRSVSLSPDGNRVLYYVAFDSRERNGTWLASTQGGTPRKLPWFGSYRWRDADRAVFVPLEPGTPHHVLEFDAGTLETRSLVNLSTKISNDQWQVSPDGRRLAFVDAKDRNLNALELPR